MDRIAKPSGQVYITESVHPRLARCDRFRPELVICKTTMSDLSKVLSNLAVGRTCDTVEDVIVNRQLGC